MDEAISLATAESCLSLSVEQHGKQYSQERDEIKLFMMMEKEQDNQQTQDSISLSRGINLIRRAMQTERCYREEFDAPKIKYGDRLDPITIFFTLTTVTRRR